MQFSAFLMESSPFKKGWVAMLAWGDVVRTALASWTAGPYGCDFLWGEDDRVPRHPESGPVLTAPVAGVLGEWVLLEDPLWLWDPVPQAVWIGCGIWTCIFWKAHSYLS